MEPLGSVTWVSWRYKSVLILHVLLFTLSGQEHPQVLEKHIPPKYLLSEGQNDLDEDEEMEEENNPVVVFKCPLKCSSSFSNKPELLNHFKTIHGFSNEIIQKVLKAHPRLNSLSEGPQAKSVEA